MDEFERYRRILFFLVWFFLLSLYALVVLRNESNTITFKVALFLSLLTLLGIVALVLKIKKIVSNFL
ncbi:hypothetical protein [Pyrococcus woesei]|uniref:hypothetical protein n=1 Tax=Pyrococcus woesei TaxID=2262 RepID=UPI003D2F3C50